MVSFALQLSSCWSKVDVPVLCAKADVEDTMPSMRQHTSIQETCDDDTRAVRTRTDFNFNSFRGEGSSAWNEWQHRTKMKRLPTSLTCNPIRDGAETFYTVIFWSTGCQKAVGSLCKPGLLANGVQILLPVVRTVSWWF